MKGTMQEAKVPVPAGAVAIAIDDSSCATRAPKEAPGQAAQEGNPGSVVVGRGLLVTEAASTVIARGDADSDAKAPQILQPLPESATNTNSATDQMTQISAGVKHNEDVPAAPAPEMGRKGLDTQLGPSRAGVFRRILSSFKVRLLPARCPQADLPGALRVDGSAVNMQKKRLLLAPSLADIPLERPQAAVPGAPAPDLGLQRLHRLVRLWRLGWCKQLRE